MKKNKFHGKLPNGEMSYSVNNYLREWRKIYRPIEKALNLTCCGFNPSFSFYDNDDRYIENGKKMLRTGSTFQMPLYVAKRISNLAKYFENSTKI